MRSTCRASLAAILFTAVAGAALAQDAGAVPPPSAPPVVKPVPDLPAIPFANPPAVVVEPALAVDQTAPTAPAVAPPASAAVASSTTDKPVAATGKRATKKHAIKPAAAVAEEKPLVKSTDSFEPVAPVAGVAVGAIANAPPPDAAASTVVSKTVVSSPPAEKAVAASDSDAAKTKTTMGVGGWLLFGVGVAFLFFVITVVRRRRALAQRQPSIVDFAGVSPQLTPVPVTRR